MAFIVFSKKVYMRLGFSTMENHSGFKVLSNPKVHTYTFSFVVSQYIFLLSTDKNTFSGFLIFLQ